MSVGYIGVEGTDQVISNELVDENNVLQPLSNYIMYNDSLVQIFFDEGLPGDPPGPVIPMVPVISSRRLFEALDLRTFEAIDNRIFEA